MTKELLPGLRSGALREALERLANKWLDHKPYRDDEYWEGVRECGSQIKKLLAALSLSSPIEPPLREITIQEFAAELYQICGALNAPAPVLDQLSAAASGRPLPYTTLLPFPEPQASSEIREALAELMELKRRMDSESGPKLWSYGTIYAYVVNRIEELLAPSRQGAAKHSGG